MKKVRKARYEKHTTLLDQSFKTTKEEGEHILQSSKEERTIAG